MLHSTLFAQHPICTATPVAVTVAPPHLDCLICNAGLMAPPTRRVTVNGLEEQFQVNYLAHWLLATQVLQSQRKARSAGEASMTQ